MDKRAMELYLKEALALTELFKKNGMPNLARYWALEAHRTAIKLKE